MVYVYTTRSRLQKHIGKKLTVAQITDVLVDLGMDVKGVSKDKDPEMKIEITAEKADMVSALGIGRAIRYYLGMARGVPRYTAVKGRCKVVVEPSVKKVRPRTAAAIIRGLKITDDVLEEMIIIQEKIHDSFGRDRKKCAIGIYPLDEVEFPVVYRAEKPEKIVFHPLQARVEMDGNEILEFHETGKKYAHLLRGHAKYPVFRDKRGEVLSLPPLINSLKTGKVESHHKDLFIECTGFNQHLLDLILKVVVTTFIDMGGKCETVTVDYGKEKYRLDLSNTTDVVSVSYINRLIGFDLSQAKVVSLLKKMMYGAVPQGKDKVKIETPTFRSDVWHDADVADDVARAYGYNNIVPRFPQIATVGSHLPFSQFRERVAASLVDMGFLELYTYILCPSERQFEKMCLESSPHVSLTGSADAGVNMCRVMILPEVLESLHVNRKHKYPQRVFENGHTIQVDASCDTGARDVAHVCACVADPKANYTQIKGVLDTFMHVHGKVFSVKAKDYPYFIPGRSAAVTVNGVEVGCIGEVHPQVLSNFGLLVPVVAFELDLGKL